MALWHLMRRHRDPRTDPALRQRAAAGRPWWRWSPAVGLAITGDLQGKVMTEVQPMKMAAAEALCETEAPAPFSVLTVGTIDGTEEVFSLRVPSLLSFLATGDFNGEVQGINELQQYST